MLYRPEVATMNLDCRACLESSFPFTMLYGLCVPDIQSYKARVLKVAPEDWRLGGGGGNKVKTVIPCGCALKPFAKNYSKLQNNWKIR